MNDNGMNNVGRGGDSAGPASGTGRRRLSGMPRLTEPERLRRLIYKILAASAAVLLCVMLESTFFARFRPFGASPDLTIFAVAALAMTEGERTGAVAGIAAGFVSDALCGAGLTLLPLVYMLTGAAAGVLTRYRFSDSALVYAIYAPFILAVRAAATLLCLSAVSFDFDLPTALRSAVLPELLATGVLFPLGGGAAWLLTRPLHRKPKPTVH